jgi:hypothetical protein
MANHCRSAVHLSLFSPLRQQNKNSGSIVGKSLLKAPAKAFLVLLRNQVFLARGCGCAVLIQLCHPALQKGAEKTRPDRIGHVGNKADVKKAADGLLQGFKPRQEDLLLDNEVKDDLPETKKQKYKNISVYPGFRVRS